MPVVDIDGILGVYVGNNEKKSILRTLGAKV
jgi:hypothetical protein